MEKAFAYLKYRIISQDIQNIQTVDEGIHFKLKKEIINCNSLDELIFRVKSKRYTYNKISRMLLHILTNFTKDESKNIDIDYIRLLGFSKDGQKYLNSIKKNISIPILTHYKKGISNVLDIEYRITCIYSLIVGDDNIIKDEFSHRPVMKDD
jgi:predicted nucleotidyltransferase